MQIKTKLTVRVLLSGLVIASSIMAQLPAHSSEIDNNIAINQVNFALQSIKKSSYISIYIVPSDLYFRFNVDSQRLEKFSCEFANHAGKTDVPARIAELLERNIKSIADDPGRSEDFRVGMKSGGTAVYLENLRPTADIHGKIGKYHIVFNGLLAQDIYYQINKSSLYIVDNKEINKSYQCSFDKSLYSE